MKQCRAAQNKLEPLLRIYFDSSWRKIDNEASARACLHRSRRSMRRAAGHGTCVPACEGRAASAGSCGWAAMAVVPAGQAVHQGGDQGAHQATDTAGTTRGDIQFQRPGGLRAAVAVPRDVAIFEPFLTGPRPPFPCSTPVPTSATRRRVGLVTCVPEVGGELGRTSPRLPMYRYDGPAEFSFNYSALKANVQWYINTIVEVQENFAADGDKDDGDKKEDAIVRLTRLPSRPYWARAHACLRVCAHSPRQANSPCPFFSRYDLTSPHPKGTAD
jgi:hypothetical protein